LQANWCFSVFYTHKPGFTIISKKNFFCHIGSTTILNVKENCSHLNIFMRKHTQKKVTVSYWSQQNGLLRVTLPATVPPGQSWHTHSTWPQKKLRDNCTEVLAGKDLFAIFALAIEASSIAKLLDGALVQLVRMPACHAGGHRFESGTHRKSGERR
jgi:hypothetical protein